MSSRPPRAGPAAAAAAPSLMAPNPPAAGPFSVEQRRDTVVVRGRRTTAEIALATGQVRFLDAKGKPLLAEAGAPTFATTQVDGAPYVSVGQQFNRGTDEGLYGLGQHQNAQMDYNGEDVDLAQHNMDIGVPFLVSTRGYGLLWDNDSITRFGNPVPYAPGRPGGCRSPAAASPGGEPSTCSTASRP